MRSLLSPRKRNFSVFLPTPRKKIMEKNPPIFALMSPLKHEEEGKDDSESQKVSNVPF
jgi:hypothetical protein